MTPNEFNRRLKANEAALKKAIQRDLPVKIGDTAVYHFRDNFRAGGFVNNGLKRWKPAKRIGRAKGSAGRYGTLLSGRNHLYRSIYKRTEPAKAIIYNNVVYAAVHNEGLRAGRGKGFIMPRRQFMGDSAELQKKIRKEIETTINSILK